MPSATPSLVSATAAHSLGNNIDPTHSYTSILAPSARVFQFPVL